jgi:hypothetical protein
MASSWAWLALEPRLTRVIATSRRRGMGPGRWPWLVVALSAYLLRDALREDERFERIKVKEGQQLTIAVRKQER